MKSKNLVMGALLVCAFAMLPNRAFAYGFCSVAGVSGMGTTYTTTTSTGSVIVIGCNVGGVNYPYMVGSTHLYTNQEVAAQLVAQCPSRRSCMVKPELAQAVAQLINSLPTERP